MLRKISLFCSLLFLASCSWFYREDIENQISVSKESMFQLPKTKDLERAAKLNIELGLGYLKQDQIARAKSKFNHAKKLAPRMPEVYYSYGLFHEQVGENKEAEKNYQKAISLNSKGGTEHYHLAMFLCRIKKYHQAEKEFLRAIEDPNYNHTAEALENLGLCMLQIPDFTKATEYFYRALRYDPNCTHALLELAILKFKEGEFEQAKAYYHRFEHFFAPTSRSLLLGIGLAKIERDKEKQANLEAILAVQYPQAKLEDLFS